MNRQLHSGLCWGGPLDGQYHSSTTFRLKAIVEDETNLFEYRIAEYEERRFWSEPFETIYSAWLLKDPIEQEKQTERILGGMTLINFLSQL